MMAFARGEYPSAVTSLQASLPIAESNADHKGVALAWFWLALVAEYEGDEVGATTAFDRAYEIFQGIDDAFWTALTVSALGDAACRRGDLDRAEALCEKERAWLARSGTASSSGTRCRPGATWSSPATTGTQRR